MLPALPAAWVEAVAKYSSATETCSVLLELFLQLFAGATLLILHFLSLLAFAVDRGLLGRNPLVGKRLFGMSFG